MVSVQTILPIFLVIALGYVAKRTVFDIRMLPGINQFVYYFAVPALLFDSASTADIDSLVNLPASSAFILGVVATALFTLLAAKIFTPQHQSRQNIIKILNMTFANYAYMGIPISFGILGEAAYLPTISIILMGNIFVVGGTQVLLETERQSTFNLKAILSIIDKSLLRSPIFLATTLGITCSANNINVPDSLQGMLDILSPAAIPAALFCLGASLKFRQISLPPGELTRLTLIKLVLHPALTMAAFYLLGVTDSLWIATTVLLTALPTGALSHVIALKYDIYHRETSQIIVVTTLCSLISLSFWVNVLN